MLDDFVDENLPPEEQWSELYGRVLSAAEAIEPTRELYEKYRRYAYQLNIHINQNLLRCEIPNEPQIDDFYQFIQEVCEWKQLIQSLETYDWRGLEEAIELLAKIERWEQGHAQAQAELKDSLDAMVKEMFRGFFDGKSDTLNDNE